MEIEFDPIKRELTLADRGLDFRDAPVVIENAVTTFEDTRFDCEVTRLGYIWPVRRRLVAVVWVEIEGGMRLVSMRKANDREQKRFQG